MFDLVALLCFSGCTLYISVEIATGAEIFLPRSDKVQNMKCNIRTPDELLTLRCPDRPIAGT